LASSDIKRRATVTVRLVVGKGDVLWANSQDSAGGKSKSAIADATERAIRSLLREIRAAESGAGTPVPASPQK
jgi:hypothetical protein